MSIENYGTTNGAPKGNKNTALTMLAGDFLKLLSQEYNLENTANKNVSSYVFNSVRENDATISIGLEPNNTKDVVFLEFIEKYPQYAKAAMTKEEWEKILIDYMNKKNDIDKN